MSVGVEESAEDGDRRDDLSDAQQIADELNVNVKLVRRWMSSGELRSSPLGRSRLVRRSWLEEFIDRRADQ